jgi:hypothetical protein
MKKNNAKVSQQKAKRAIKRNKRKKSGIKRITLPNGMTIPGNTTPGVKITSLEMLPQNVRDWVAEKNIDLDLGAENTSDGVVDNQEFKEESGNKNE